MFRLPRMFRTIENRDYRLYFFGQLVSLLWSWLQSGFRSTAPGTRFLRTHTKLARFRQESLAVKAAQPLHSGAQRLFEPLLRSVKSGRAPQLKGEFRPHS
jgi:hypothetical protein